MTNPRRVLLALILWMLLPAAVWAEATPLARLTPAEQEARAAVDAGAILRYRQGLADTVAHLAALPDLKANRAIPGAAARESLREAWQRYLDYALALDSIARYYRDFYRLPSGEARDRSLALLRAAYLAQYRQALDLLALLEANPQVHVLLNEPLPALGLPAKTYSAYKFRFLNVARGSEFATLEALAGDAAAFPLLAAATDDDRKKIWDYGKGQGPLLTARNAVKIVGDTGFAAFFPVQAGVAEWMGDTKTYRIHRSLIVPAQISTLKARLRPGDVMLERREWYLSNAGLPGFWPHVAFYVGTPDERAALAADPEVRAWVRAQGVENGELETLLETRAPEAYQRSLRGVEGGQARVIEAISEGVSLTSLEHSADADSLAVLRPRVSALEKARALASAFGYVGRPYDFNFDFLTDSTLVCSEVVYKAYEPTPDRQGLKLPLTEVVGRWVMTPNALAELHARTAGQPDAPFEWVAFLDGSERQGKALERDEPAFKESWRRPKWHVLLQ